MTLWGKMRWAVETGSKVLICDPTRPQPAKIADPVTSDPETRFPTLTGNIMKFLLFSGYFYDTMRNVNMLSQTDE